jgi:hypothetical protein
VKPDLSKQAAFTTPGVGIGVEVNVCVMVAVTVRVGGVPVTVAEGVTVPVGVNVKVGVWAVPRKPAIAYIMAPCQFMATSFDEYDHTESAQ